jgi:hypothetical protein
MSDKPLSPADDAGEFVAQQTPSWRLGVRENAKNSKGIRAQNQNQCLIFLKSGMQLWLLDSKRCVHFDVLMRFFAFAQPSTSNFGVEPK